MGSLTLVVLLVIAIGVICILITRKPSAKTDKTDASWECQTCGAGNSTDTPRCDECGMDR
jgi:hypothetical protein